MDQWCNPYTISEVLPKQASDTHITSLYCIIYQILNNQPLFFFFRNMFSWINCSDTLYSVARVAGTAFIVIWEFRLYVGPRLTLLGLSAGMQMWVRHYPWLHCQPNLACAPAIRSCNYDLIYSNSFPLLEKHLPSGCLSSIKKVSGLLQALFIAGVVVIYLGKVLGHGGNYT